MRRREAVVSDATQFTHHGFTPVRKSMFSSHAESTTTPSASATRASASDWGAGPRMTLPVASYCEPWHGHMNLFAARFHGTTHPRCVHTALTAYVQTIAHLPSDLLCRIFTMLVYSRFDDVVLSFRNGKRCQSRNFRTYWLVPPSTKSKTEVGSSAM